MNAITRDVTDADFEREVLARSRELPVIVDLWAPWCAPCRQLAPVLERVVAECGVAVELVKVNIDENPQVATSLGARSIPLVLAFKDGKIVDRFLGAQPESAVRAFIDGLAPSEADRLVASAGTHRETGNEAAEEADLQAALGADPRHAGARIALATLYANRDDLDGALEILAKADPSPEVERLAAQLRLQKHAGADRRALEARLAEHPDDLSLAVELGRTLAAQGEHEPALEALIDAVRRDATFDDGAARKAVLDLFAALGAQHPLTKAYRRKLSQALF